MTELEEPAPAAKPNDPAAEALRSVHTTSLPALLQQLASTLLVSTYQAGKLIIVREQDGVANTHFRNFRVPMGLAYQNNRLAVGTRTAVWDFHNVPSVAPKVEPAGKHDACFLPRSSHFTGDIAGHEMAWAGNELWVVNTRFSCLCTLDEFHSFVPRWRPSFITGLAPQDRCHLNGLGMVAGRPRYVTALGTTDTSAGWREDKAQGGCLIDVPSGEFVLRGLSMPHSPRWYDGRLWVLESGAGSLSVIDPLTGRAEPVALLPGFTRGLDFAGPFAFVGLSQVRESNIFGGLPITERLTEDQRACGVWVVDTRSGQTVAFLRFEAGVREIFAVQLLPGIRYPDLINEDGDLIAGSYVLPDEALAQVDWKAT